MTNLWKRFHCSVCSITFLDCHNERITSGTGFFTKGYLITNNHVIQVVNAQEVVIRFVQEDGFSELTKIKYDYLTFKSYLLYGDDKNNWDYAVLELPDSMFKNIPSLEVSDNNVIMVGSAVVLLGFQFEQQNLSMHQGIVSSTYSSNEVKVIQLDSSVNHGNSGGPLIDIETGQIIGIVTRKVTGLTKQFDQLMQSFDESIKILEERKGSVFISGVDPLGATLQIQKQMKQTAIELTRSANVGIGYAFSIEKIKEALD